MKFDNRLDYATKVPYFDEVREFELSIELSLTKRWFKYSTLLVKSMMKHFVFLTKSYKILNKNKINFSDYEWFIVNDHSGHCELFIHGVLDNFSSNEKVLHLTVNPNILSRDYDIHLFCNKIDFFTLNKYAKAFFYCWAKKEIFRGYGLWSGLIFLNQTFNTARVLQAFDYYEKVNFNHKAKLLTLCDSHWHQNVLTSVFNERGLKTFTLMHGIPTEWHLHYPFLSDYVLTWGKNMSEATIKNCPGTDRSRLIEIGNPKYPNLQSSQILDAVSFSEIEEIVFLSPGYDSFKSYGFNGLEMELRKFLNLDVKNTRLAIRPRPNPIEQLFINKLLNELGLLGQVKILNEPDFSSLVTKKRIFIGSISSAIADIILLGGYFIGLKECMEHKILETTITFSPDNYFNFKNLEKFLTQLNDPPFFGNYLEKIVEMRDGLAISVPKHLDKYLDCYDM